MGIFVGEKMGGGGGGEENRWGVISWSGDTDREVGELFLVVSDEQAAWVANKDATNNLCENLNK